MSSHECTDRNGGAIAAELFREAPTEKLAKQRGVRSSINQEHNQTPLKQNPLKCPGNAEDEEKGGRAGQYAASSRKQQRHPQDNSNQHRGRLEDGAAAASKNFGSDSPSFVQFKRTAGVKADHI